MTLALRGTVIRRVAPRAVGYAAMGALVAFLVREVGLELTFGSLAHSLLGIALGMLLVFRTNSAYDRYWEGRKRWSDIVAAARNAVRAATSYVGRGTPIPALASAFVVALRHRLGNRSETLAARRLLSDGDRQVLGPRAGNPLAIAERMSASIRHHIDEGTLSTELAHDLERYVGQLVEHQSACERIATSPMPLAYAAQIRQLLVVYLATLPFALVHELGWLVVPAMAVIAFGLIGIEEAGLEIEEPFGDDENDLPLDEFCSVVREDVKALYAQATPMTIAARAKLG